MKKHAKSKMYLTFLKRVGLTNVINQVTHIKNVGLGFSPIYHFLTTDEHLYNNTGALPTTASDHYFVYTTRKKPRIKHPKAPPSSAEHIVR